MPEVACLDKFKRVLVGIPEIHGFPIRDGKTFRIKYVNGLSASFDLLCKKRVQGLVVECCQNLSMQQVLVGLPMDFGRDQLEMVVARAMFGFSKIGIKTGLGNCPLYIKGLITGKVQNLMEELKKGGSEEIMTTETTPTTQRRPVSWSESWDKLIDHLIGEEDVPVGKYWEISKPTEILIKFSIFNNYNTAKTFVVAAIERSLMKRVGGKRYCKWQIFNLPWPVGANGKTAVIEKTSALENPDSPVDFLASALEAIVDAVEFREYLESTFGNDSEMAKAFAEKCGKQIELLERVKKGAELYATFVAGMKNL